MQSAAIISKSKSIYENSMLRQAMVLFLGKGGAQLLALLSYPVLTRWYTSAQFGEFAFINSLLALLLIASSGHYEGAIVLTKNEQQAKSLFQLSQTILMAYVLGLCLILALPFVQHYWLSRFHNPLTLWLLPLLVLCIGYWNIVQNWLVRFQQYHRLSIAVFLQRLLILGASIAAIFLTGAVNGLVAGLLAGALLIFALALHYQRLPLLAPKKELKLSALANRDFPLFVAPGFLLHLFCLHLPILWLNMFNSPKEAGYFSMAFTLISVPFTCYEISFGQIFYQRLAQADAQEKWVLLKKYCLNYGSLLLLGGFMAVFFAEPFTTAFLGEHWRNSGKIASMMGPFIFAFGLSSLFITYLTVIRKQKLVLYTNLTRLCLLVLALSSGFFLDNVYHGYRLMSLFSLLLVLVLGSWVIRNSKRAALAQPNLNEALA